MENLDMQTDESVLFHDEDELFMRHVVQEDHEILYLDTCLNEICRQSNVS